MKDRARMVSRSSKCWSPMSILAVGLVSLDAACAARAQGRRNQPRSHHAGRSPRAGQDGAIAGGCNGRSSAASAGCCEFFDAAGGLARRRPVAADRNGIRAAVVGRTGRRPSPTRRRGAAYGSRREELGDRPSRRRPVAEGRADAGHRRPRFLAGGADRRARPHLVVTAAIFDLVEHSRRRFDAEPEIADRQQRIRVAVDALYRDLLMARAVMPYRLSGATPDPAGTFKDDVVTIVSERPPERTIDAGVLRPARCRVGRVAADACGRWRRRRAGCRRRDVAVVRVLRGTAAVAWRKLGSLQHRRWRRCARAGSRGPNSRDGPLCPAAAGAALFDADLLRVRKMAVRMRVAGAAAPVGFEVTPRNRNQGR